MAQNTVKIQAPSIVPAAVCTPLRSKLKLGKTGIKSLIRDLPSCGSNTG